MARIPAIRTRNMASCFLLMIVFLFCFVALLLCWLAVFYCSQRSARCVSCGGLNSRTRGKRPPARTYSPLLFLLASALCGCTIFRLPLWPDCSFLFVLFALADLFSHSQAAQYSISFTMAERQRNTPFRKAELRLQKVCRLVLHMCPTLWFGGLWFRFIISPKNGG
jgi:hypothetical protein